MLSSSMVGFNRSSNSVRSCRRRLVQGGSCSWASSARPRSFQSLFLPTFALVHGDRLQLIHDPGPHLHEPVAVPQQLSQVTILRIWYPHSRKTIFQHQLQQESRILPIGFLLTHSLGLDLRRITDPQPHTQFCQQSLEPTRVPGGLHPHPHAASLLLEVLVELLRFSITVVQPPFSKFSCLGIRKRNLLEARVIIDAYNHHVRLLSPEPVVVNQPQSTQVEGADIVMQSNSNRDKCRFLARIPIARGRLESARIASAQAESHRIHCAWRKTKWLSPA